MLSPPTPPAESAAMTALVAIFGLMAAVFTAALDHQYDLTAALYSAAVMGTTATVLVVWLLSTTFPRSPWPPAQA